MVDQIIVEDQMIEGLNLEILTIHITLVLFSVGIARRPKTTKDSAIVHRKIK